METEEGLLQMRLRRSKSPPAVNWDPTVYAVESEIGRWANGVGRRMWPDLIQKAKQGGLDAIETYVFWNAHEPRRREYNFEGNNDLIRFIKEIQNAGLYAILRIGPYACAEWNYGGFPAWLRQIPGLQMRTDSQPFKIENEYGNVKDPYGDAGKRYIQWCAQMADSLHIGVPWIMCQQDDAPQPMINTCNGFYCHSFRPNNPNSPKMFTENWTGWFKQWDKPDPHRLAEDLAYSVAHFFQSNGTFHNYYMYHGGTNFGRTSGGPYITTSYDYDAPLDEYGNLRQPKWGHLKDLHTAIKTMEKALTYGDRQYTGLSNGLSVTKFYGQDITPGCFLTNENSSNDATIDYEGNKYFVPAWSISILPDCNHEVYNTAKVNVQTSIMVKKQNKEEDESTKLKWSWRPETLKLSLKGLGGSFKANKLLEQISTSADASDYMWYMTSVNISDQEHMTLRVNTMGHVLHAFVNGRLIGSQYASNGGFNFVFEARASMEAGTNYISLLSATVGLKNYGAFFELMPAGIVGGPVQLIGENATLDLSSNTWSYKIGLDGWEKQLFLRNSTIYKWLSNMIVTQRPFTWYKTNFQAPLGSEPVVVDLLGMGKGEAWVNGHSIGRFWPSYKAKSDGCKQVCDYRGNFKSESCQTSCGEPAQRWYHVPRSFLKDGELNTLVLFEEAGGNPANVSFQTVTVGTACANAAEGKTVALSCQGGQKISNIEFASFGNPTGSCGSFQKGDCEAKESLSVIQKACVGQATCTIEVTENLLGMASCSAGTSKRLAIQASC
ncbi:Beta-galactosidase 7 [Apostasia shenzhenica]|uniref:beta-galactosidase n=1 Tax=Apostasia shenzhenica TaxID=1088818 RepID=A0A2I0ACH6_9ASPA|nr:Beta-galactosidase 7 [Apostasia shenzhenica]